LTIKERMRIKPNTSGTHQGRQAAVSQNSCATTGQQNRHQTGQRAGQRGFTLLEIMIVMIIMAIMAAVAIPAFSSWREKQAVQSATQTLMSQLKQARTLALAENRDVTIKICDGTVASAWVYDSDSPTATCDPCLDIYIPGSNPQQPCTKNKYDFSQFSKDLSVTSNVSTAKVVFTSRGSINPPYPTFTVTASNYNRAITVNGIGRARIK